MAATIGGVDYSNEACAAMKAGRFEESIALHQKALEHKLRFHPEASIQAAISYNGMGEAMLRAGKLQEADEAFHKALPVREGDGPVLDAAVTRDNIGQLREAQGRFAEAREIRIRGSGQQMVCGYYYVSLYIFITPISNKHLTKLIIPYSAPIVERSLKES